jgi:hypothetical protein
MIFTPGTALDCPGREKTSPGRQNFARDGEKSPGASGDGLFRIETVKNYVTFSEKEWNILENLSHGIYKIYY